jgi:hypothetical protein
MRMPSCLAAIALAAATAVPSFLTRRGAAVRQYS